jgi:hypothetical protein
MATTGGQLGSGVEVGFSAASPVSFTKVAQVLDVTPPQKTRDRVETTVHGATSERSYIPGLAEWSAMELVLLADLGTTSSHITISDMEISQATAWWRVEIPMESTLATTNFFVYEFEGRVAKFAISTPIDSRKEIAVTVEVAGSMTVYENQASAIA